MGDDGAAWGAVEFYALVDEGGGGEKGELRVECGVMEKDQSSPRVDDLKSLRRREGGDL